MKITKNFIDGQTYFYDVKVGQIFTTDDHMIFMKIREVIPDEGDVVNAIYMEDGDTASIREDEKVKIIDSVELILNVEV
jgi:polyribonucleotide nucleotidyltransferase